MAEVTITNTRKIEFGTHCSAGDLRELLDGIPDGVVVTVNQSHGGQLDGTSTTLTVNMAGVQAGSGVHLHHPVPGGRR